MSSRCAVLVPVRSFTDAKGRLAPALDPATRVAVARHLATTVVVAAGSLPVTVVSDDADVRVWATELGARVIGQSQPGLDAAVTEGVELLAASGFGRVVVAHADLPLATSLAVAADGQEITLVPDRRNDGTNVIGLPARCGFRFAYGPDSFARHRTEAERLGLGPHVVIDPSLAWDVDHPEDLALPDGTDLVSRVATAASSPAATSPPASPTDAPTP